MKNIEIVDAILEDWLRERKQQFTGLELEDAVTARLGHRLTGGTVLRLMRMLKERGAYDIVCLNRAKSLYGLYRSEWEDDERWDRQVEIAEAQRRAAEIDEEMRCPEAHGGGVSSSLLKK